jgi:hypothetical protein
MCLYFRPPDYTKGIFQSIGFKEFHTYLTLSEEERASKKVSGEPRLADSQLFPFHQDAPRDRRVIQLAFSQVTRSFARFLHLLPSRELAFSSTCLRSLACLYLFESCSLTAREMQIEKLLTPNYDRRDRPARSNARIRGIRSSLKRAVCDFY